MNAAMSSNKYWIVICVAVLFSTITAAVPVPVNDRSARLGILDHQKRINGFRCSAPQERSYKIEKLIVGEIATADVVVPYYTVIRTCDEGTGCCDTESKICAAVTVEYEEVEVKVFDVVNSTGTTRTLKIQHHKECKCQLRSEVHNRWLTPNATLIN